jgi:hypothetical protein
MTSFVGHSPNGMGQENTAILSSLLDHLIARTILTPPEVVSIWPAAGSADTELGVLMEPEVCHGETEVYTRVQA